MTIEERADLIIRTVSGYGFADSHPPNGIQFVVEHLQAAREEGFHQGFKDSEEMKCHSGEYTKGFSDAVEKAAKVADEYAAIHRETGQNNCPDRIRALKPQTQGA